MLRIITPEEVEALKDIIFVKLIIPAVLPKPQIASQFSTPLHTPHSTAHSTLVGPSPVLTSVPETIIPDTPIISLDGTNSSPSGASHHGDTLSTPGTSPPNSLPPSPSPVHIASSPVSHSRQSPHPPNNLFLQIPRTDGISSSESSPTASPNKSPDIPLGANIENHISPRFTRSPRTPITIQLPVDVTEDESQPIVPKLKLGTISEDEATPSPNQSAKATPSYVPTPPATPHTPKVSEKQTIIIKIQAHQTLNTLITDIWGILPFFHFYFIVIIFVMCK